MVQENTPPPSPSEAIMDLSDNDDDDVGEPLEVIDLDELEEGIEEEVDDDGEDELEDGGDETIQEEIEDNSILKFTEHSGKFNVKNLLNYLVSIIIKKFFYPSDSVFCVDVQPGNDDPVVASGGQDDTCYLWSLKTGKVLKKLENFKDSVVHVKFNFNGSYLAVADMAGTIYVIKMSPNIVQEPVFSFETGDVTWLDWHPGANVLFAGTVDSSLWMWKIPSELCFEFFHEIYFTKKYF